jgi:hypothetical protein
MIEKLNEPVVGSTRTITKFLILPKKIGDKRKWMQSTRILQRYVPRRQAGKITFKWVNVSFKD